MSKRTNAVLKFVYVLLNNLKLFLDLRWNCVALVLCPASCELRGTRDHAIKLMATRYNSFLSFVRATFIIATFSRVATRFAIRTNASLDLSLFSIDSTSLISRTGRFRLSKDLLGTCLKREKCGYMIIASQFYCVCIICHSQIVSQDSLQ